MVALGPTPGSAFDDASIDAYLADASSWRSAMSTALLDLDEQVKLAGLPDASGDVALAFSLWRAASSRIDEVTAARGQGRMGNDERTAVRRLVWATVSDDTGVPMASNLPEARRMVDALVGRLGTSVTNRDAQITAVTGLLAPITERVLQAATNAAALGEMVRQVEALSDRLAKLGPDSSPTVVTSEVAAIDRALAPIERDLTDLARARSSLATDAAALPARVRTASELEAATRDLAERCKQKITDAPNLAVPSVAVLGPPPTIDEVGADEWRAARSTLDAYSDRLARVERALAVANAAYGAPLQRREDLRGLLDGYRAMAASRGLGEQPEASAAYDAARAALFTAPCDLGTAESLVAAYQRQVNAVPMTPRFPEDKR
jgi:hypothetical protein